MVNPTNNCHDAHRLGVVEPAHIVGGPSVARTTRATSPGRRVRLCARARLSRHCLALSAPSAIGRETHISYTPPNLSSCCSCSKLALAPDPGSHIKHNMF